MVKIKRKVEMTHEEYAKFMIDKFGIASYESELIDNNILDAPMEFEQTFTLKPMRKDDNPVIARSFNGVVIEAEENVTEETVIDEMLLVYDNGVTHIAENKNLSFISKGNLKSAYYMNDDLRLILIWRDGKLVE